MRSGSTAEPAPLKRLEAAGRAGGGRRRRPGHLWDPPFSGDLDIRIAADGSWHYLGTPILRQRLVELFASILRREADGRFYLVTPVEKVGITVVDAPFLAVAMDVEGEGPARRITFHSNVGDRATAGPVHRLRFEIESGSGGLKPYVDIRDGLEALVSRALVHDLVELASEEMVGGERRFGIRSGGMFFDMGPADMLLEP